MADVELVIKIPEETVNEIKDNAMFAKDIADNIKWNVTSAIVNGTPLPKGHGDLKDVGWLLNKMNNADADTLPRTPNEYYAWSFAQALLTQTPTIIKADIEREENNNADSD